MRKIIISAFVASLVTVTALAQKDDVAAKAADDSSEHAQIHEECKAEAKRLNLQEDIDVFIEDCIYDSSEAPTSVGNKAEDDD